MKMRGLEIVWSRDSYPDLVGISREVIRMGKIPLERAAGFEPATTSLGS